MVTESPFHFNLFGSLNETLLYLCTEKKDLVSYFDEVLKLPKQTFMKPDVQPIPSSINRTTLDLPPDLFLHQLYNGILDVTRLEPQAKKQLRTRFESSIYIQTLKTLLSYLPEQNRDKLQRTMYFRPDFFLNRSLAILQMLIPQEELLSHFDAVKEHTFLSSLEQLVQTCCSEDRARISAYLTATGYQD